MLKMVLVGAIGGGGPWGPPRMIVAMVMGEGVLPLPASFDLGIMMTAMMIHFVLSIILGVVLQRPYGPCVQPKVSSSRCPLDQPR